MNSLYPEELERVVRRAYLDGYKDGLFDKNIIQENATEGKEM
mgnify:CR=1 FL=1